MDEISNPNIKLFNLSFTSIIPNTIGVGMLYDFSVNRKLNIGEKLQIKLPGWHGNTVSTDSYCDTTAFIIQLTSVSNSWSSNTCTSNSGFTYTTQTACENAGTWTAGACTVNEGGRETSQEACITDPVITIISLTLANADLPANSNCIININGLISPPVINSADYMQTILHKVIGGKINTAFIAIPDPFNTRDATSAQPFHDQLDIIDAAPGAENVNVIYTFKYNSDIHFGYKIALSLPDWFLFQCK
jgi:hypothetical protein